VFHHFSKTFFSNKACSFIAISVPQIQNLRKCESKLKLLQAKDKLKQPNTANFGGSPAKQGRAGEALVLV